MALDRQKSLFKNIFTGGKNSTVDSSMISTPKFNPTRFHFADNFANRFAKSNSKDPEKETKRIREAVKVDDEVSLNLSFDENIGVEGSEASVVQIDEVSEPLNHHNTTTIQSSPPPLTTPSKDKNKGQNDFTQPPDNNSIMSAYEYLHADRLKSRYTLQNDLITLQKKLLDSKRSFQESKQRLDLALLSLDEKIAEIHNVHCDLLLAFKLH